LEDSGDTEFKGGTIRIYPDLLQSLPRLSLSTVNWRFVGVSLTGVELELAAGSLLFTGANSIERFRVSSPSARVSVDGSLAISRYWATDDRCLLSLPSGVSISLLFLRPWADSAFGEGIGALVATNDGRPSQKFYHERNQREFAVHLESLFRQVSTAISQWGFIVEDERARVKGTGYLTLALSGTPTLYLEDASDVTVYWFSEVGIDSYYRPTVSSYSGKASVIEIEDVANTGYVVTPAEAAAGEVDHTVRDLSITILVVMIALTIVVVVFIILCSKRGGGPDA
jgi:hypothetical protein